MKWSVILVQTDPGRVTGDLAAPPRVKPWSNRAGPSREDRQDARSVWGEGAWSRHAIEVICWYYDADHNGEARQDTCLSSLRGRPLVVSIVSVEEILEGATDQTTTLRSLQRFSIQGLHLSQAERCARLQRRSSRRMGENDAWLVATAQSLDADVVGADRTAFERLGTRYLRFRSDRGRL